MTLDTLRKQRGATWASVAKALGCTPAEAVAMLSGKTSPGYAGPRRPVVAPPPAMADNQDADLSALTPADAVSSPEGLTLPPGLPSGRWVANEDGSGMSWIDGYDWRMHFAQRAAR